MNNIFKLILDNVKQVHSSIEDRVDAQELRVNSLKNLSQPLTKVAFDTRRINQETEYNPRQNLQYYQRSTPFITKDAGEQIKTLFKLKTAVDAIKEDFLGDPDWHTSYCRILSSALDRTLRVEQKDMDFFQPQMDYLNEMLYLRYRINKDDINKLSENELKGIILNRDEKLLHKQIYAQYKPSNEIKKETVQQPVEAIKKETIQQSNDIVTGQQQESRIVSNNNSNSIRSKDGDKEINITINVS